VETRGSFAVTANKSRGGSKHKGVVNEPTAVINALVFASLEGIASQIGYQGSAQLHMRAVFQQMKKGLPS
jgi:hypothetical protein